MVHIKRLNRKLMQLKLSVEQNEHQELHEVLSDQQLQGYFSILLNKIMCLL